jgi:peptide/nickel transport system permease protein
MTGEGRATVVVERDHSGEAGRVTGPKSLGRSVRDSQFLLAIRRQRGAQVGLAILLIFSLLAIFPGVVAPYDPSAISFAVGAGPSLHHLLGTTSYGQDVFSQLVWGTRVSLVVALATGAAVALLSVVVGVTAAFVGGGWDKALSSAIDIFLVIPAFPLIIVIASYAKSAGTVVIVLVLVATGWSFGARQLRAQALSLKEREFVLAAVTRGERKWYIILRELLPSMTSLIAAVFLSAALYAVLAYAGLQFVGLGSTTVQSWGSMLYWSESAQALQSGESLWEIAPAVCVALLGAALALLNYAFDGVTNPALRRR